MTDDPSRLAEAEVLPIGARAHRDGRTAIAHVIAVADEAVDAADAADRLVAAMASGLVLAGARLFVVSLTDDAEDDSAGLSLVASLGSHASLTRDMPTVPLGTGSDVGRVALSGKADYHGDLHGLGQSPPANRQGLVRWRDAVTTQASAVLPLAIRGRLIGVLALEWAAPRPFDDEERASLEAVASAAALVIDSLAAEARAPGADPSVPEQAPTGCTPAPAAELAVTSDGMVVPVGASGSWDARPALRLHVQASAPGVADTEEAFWDVVGVRNGLVVVTLGIATAPAGGASETAETARHMLRASALQGAGPARGLALLAGWLSAAGRGDSWVSAVTCEIDVRRATMRWCAAGSLAVATRFVDDRSDVVSAAYPPLGATASPRLVDRDALLLPGDTVALCAGDIASLTTGEGQRRSADALRSMRAAETGVGLGAFMDLLRTPGCGVGALVIEVAD